MSPPRTAIRAAARVLGLFVLGLLVLAAGALTTGRISYVVTNGVSMQPVYYAGDLVVVARAKSYGTGDIVAYHGGAGNRLTVLHRIIGGDAGGYVFKGDNNASVDPLTPAKNQLIGRAVLHVPKLGGVLQSPLSRAVLALALLGAVGALFLKPKVRTTAAAPDPPTPSPSAPRARPRAAAWKAVVAIDVLLGVGVGLTYVLAPGPAATAPTPAPVTQTGVLAYWAKVPAGDTYPTGQIGTGDPVFLKLATSVGLSYHYSTDAPPESVTGTVRLDATLANSSGWRTKVPLAPDTPLASGTAELAGALDLARLQAVADSVAKATGTSSSPLDLTVTATATAGLDGAAPATFTSELPFKLTPTMLTLSGAAKPGPSPYGPALTSTKPLKGADPPPAAPRKASHPLRIGLLAALLLGAVAAVMLWPESAEETASTPPALHAHAVGLDLGSAARVQLADRSALDTLAAGVGGPVIEGDDGWAAVVTPGVVYWTGSSLPAKPRPARTLTRAAKPEPAAAEQD